MISLEQEVVEAIAGAIIGSAYEVPQIRSKKNSLHLDGRLIFQGSLFAKSPYFLAALDQKTDEFG